MKIVLAVGQKLPRWPECHIPEWATLAPPGQADFKKQELLKYIAATITHYKNNEAIIAWQIENEPFLNFGECPTIDGKIVDEEIALVRSLDRRPVLMTDSGELSIWYQAARRGDIFGTTMYRWVWSPIVGAYKYPLPPAFFRIKERLVRLFVGQEKPFWVIELQGEPWQHKQIYEIPVEEQKKNLNFGEFTGIINYAKQTDFTVYYLWGVEWWYALKQNGHPEYWEYVKNLVFGS